MFKALSPNMEDRYSSVAEFAKEMLDFLSNPRAGQRQLSALFRDKEDEEDENAENQSNKSRILEGLTNNIGQTILGRLFAALATAPIAILACINIDVFGGLTPNVFGILAIIIIVATAVVWPVIGFALACATLSVALALSGNMIIAVVFGLISLTWCVYNFKKNVANTNCAASFSLFGSFGFSQAGPFISGLFCDLKDGVINTVFGFVICLVLAGLGSMTLVG